LLSVYSSAGNTYIDGLTTVKAIAFDNSSNNTITDGELITWGFLKSFIDVVLPIGVLMLSSNGAPPSTFGGYITWTVYAAADSKYLKMTGVSEVVGTL
jgi:hypothetical protein